jgi:hypothetical protein
MFREIVLLGLGAIFGLGATMAALAAPAHYTNIPPWVWHWLFWSGIALMVLMVVDAACLVSWRPHLSTGILLNIGLAFVAAAVISQYAPTHEGRVSPSLPLTIGELRMPDFWAKSGLVPENQDWDTAALIIRGVYISNFSLTRSVTLRFFLVMKNEKGANWSLEGTGVGRFNRVIGQFKAPPQPGPGQLQEKYILSPVAIPPQQTVSGDLAFITITTMKFTNDVEKEEALALARGVLDPMVEGGTPDEKYTYALRITDIVTDTTIEIAIPNSGYKGH